MPWVRIDEHALNHVKLTALSAAAFRLWVEGLAHCQKHLTDGALSADALRGFRYTKPALVAELSRSVDGKAPLWIAAAGGGYAVHDYLQWNDDKDTVLANREKARGRMAKLRGGSSGARSGRRSREHATEQPIEATPNVRDTTPLVLKEPVGNTRPAGSSIVARGAHRSHAVCGVVCVPASAWEGMLAKLGGNTDRLSGWIGGVMATWQAKVDAGEVVPDGDDFAFWRHRWAESFGTTKSAETRKDDPARVVPDSAATKLYLADMRAGKAS